jgi:hypothetical protein
LTWEAHKKAALSSGEKIEQRANTRLDCPKCQEFLDTDERGQDTDELCAETFEVWCECKKLCVKSCQPKILALTSALAKMSNTVAKLNTDDTHK